MVFICHCVLSANPLLVLEIRHYSTMRFKAIGLVLSFAGIVAGLSRREESPEILTTSVAVPRSFIIEYASVSGIGVGYGLLLRVILKRCSNLGKSS